MSASSRLCSSASEDAGSEPIICAISFDRLCWSLLVAFTEPFGKGAKQLSQAAGVNVRPIFCFLQPDSAKSCNRVSVAERLGVNHGARIRRDEEHYSAHIPRRVVERQKFILLEIISVEYRPAM